MHWITVLVMTFCCALFAHAQNVELNERRKRDVTSDCRAAVIDLYVIVETSRLVGSTNLNFVRSYLKSVSKKLSIEPEKTRISLTSFGGDVINIANLSDVTTRDKAEEAFDKLGVTGRGVRVHTAMEFVADNLFNPEHGRNEDNEAICLITMGSRIPTDISESVKKLQQKCRVVVVGSGFAIYRQLKQIPSEPFSKHLIFSSRYKDLPRRVNHVLKSICTQPVGAPRAEVFEVEPYVLAIRWVAQTFASKYQAEIRELGATEPLQRIRNIPVTKTWVRFRGLEQASTYVANFWAFGRDGELGPKRTLILNTGVARPVIQVNQSSVTSSSVRLSWNSNSEVSVNYYVTVKAVNNTSNVVRQTFVATEAEMKGLSSGTNFSATVAARSSGITSKQSLPGYFVTAPSAPKLTVQQVRHISIDLMWPPVTGADYYVLTIYDVEANVTTVHDNLKSTTFKISDLTPSQKYQFQAYTIGKTGLISRLSRLVTAYTAPSNPDDVTLDYVTEHAAQVHWSPQPAAVRYSVIVTSSSDKGFRKERNVTDTEFWLGGMKSGHFYKFSVYSVGKGNVLDKNVVYPTFVQTVPSPPEGVRLLYSNSTSLEVTWNYTIGVKIYHVEAEKMISGEPTGDIYRSVNSTVSTALVDALEPGVEYRISVKTEGYQGGISKPSETVITSTVPDVPAKPRATWVNMTTMALAMEPAQGAVSYVIEAQPLEKDENHRQIIPFTDVNEITVDKMLPGLWYSIKVRSINAFGKENPESSEVLHEQSVPAPPHVGSFWKVTSSSLLFRWPKVKGALSYYLYVSTSDFSGLTTEPTEVRYHTNDTQYQVWGLASGTLYNFKVQSIGHSDRLSSIGPAAYERTIPQAPTGLRHTAVTPSTVTLQWNAAKGTRQYEISMHTVSERFETRIFSFRNRVLASGLKTGTWYNFTVYSRDAKDRLNENGSITVNVQTVPLPPARVQLRDARIDGFTVQWKEMWGAKAYYVRAETSDSEAINRETTVRVNDSLRAEVGGLDAGTRYRFYVSSIGFQEQVSKETDRVVDTTLPITPEKPQLETVTTQSMSLLWSDVKGATYFYVRVIQFAPSNNTEWEVRSDEAGNEVGGLVPGAWYNMSVFSVGTRNRRNWVDSEALQAQTIPLAPITINISDITNTSIQLSWNSVIGAGYYVISTRNEDSDIVIPDAETVVTEYLQDSLEPGTEYTFRVTSIGEDEDRRSSKSSPIKEETDPATPDQPTVTTVTSRSVALTWNDVKGARGYLVKVTNLETGETTQHEVGESRSDVHGLDSGTHYKFNVFSVGKLRRRSEYGSPDVSTYTAPATPHNVRTVSSTTHDMELVWNEVKGAISYSVSVRSNSRLIQTLPATEARLLVVNLVPGTQYDFHVTAIGMEERKSEEEFKHTDSTEPSTPSSAVVTSFDETSVSITWQAVEGNVIQYVIMFEEEGSTTIRRHQTKELEFKQTELKSGLRYVIRIQTIGDGGKTSDQSEAVVQQTMTIAPQRFVITSVGTDYVTLEWSDVTGASGYELSVTSDTGDVDIQQLSVTSTRVTSLEAGSKYLFSLKSIGDSMVRSQESNNIETSTVPANPTGLQTSEVHLNRAFFFWQPVKGAVRYKVKVTSTESDVPTVDDVIGPDARVRSLRPGAWYNFTVYSVGEEERVNEEGSDELVVQTNPRFPGRFVVDNFTTNSIGFWWRSSYGATYYDVTVSSTNDVSSSDVMQFTTTDTSHILTSLQSGTEYDVTMQVVGQQEGRMSEKKKAFSQATLPDTPSLPIATSVSTDSITIEWNNVRGAASYDVTMINNELEQVLSSDTNSVEASPLRPGAVYQFSVYSIGVAKNGIGSETLKVQTVTLAPGSFAISDVTTDSVFLSWDEVYGATSYKVRIISEDGQRNEDTSTTSLLVTSLNPGTEYRISVRSVGMDDVTESVETEGITMATLPHTVDEITVDDVTTTEVGLSWKPAPGAQRYDVIVKRDNGVTNRSINSDSSELRVTGLRTGSWYEFRVHSVSGSGVVNFDPDVSVRKQTVPNPPNQIDVDEVTTSAIHLSWRKIHGASSYDVILSSTLGDVINTFTVPSSETPKYKISDLSPGNHYVVTIRTVGDEGQISSHSREIREGTRPAATSGVDVGDVTTTSVELTWQSVIGAEKYHVIYRTSGSNDDRHVLETVDTQSVVIGLNPGTWYDFVVFSIGIKDRRNERGSEKIQIQTVPLAPDNVIITNVTTSSVVLRWSDVIGAAQYRLEYGNVDDDVTNTMETTLTRIEVTSLSSGTRYWFVVKSIGEESRMSEASLQVEETTVPSRPLLPLVVGFTTTSLNLDWDDVRGATSYVIMVTSDNQLVQEFSSDSSQAAIENLNSGTFYDVTVYSVGESQKRNKEGSDIVTQQTVPSVPANFQLSDVTTTSLMASWDPVHGAVSYIVTSSTDDSSVTIVNPTITTTVTSITVDDLIAGTGYRFTVKAVGHENIMSDETQEIRETTLPNVPVGLVIDSVATTTVKLSWMDMKGATSYNVKVKQTSSGNVIDDVTTTKSDVTIGGLEPGIIYDFTLNSVGTKDRVNMQDEVTITQQTVPANPENLYISDVTTTSVTASWDDVTGATSYIVNIVQIVDSKPVQLSPIVTSQTSFVISGLEAGFLYRFTVNAVAHENLTSNKSHEVEEQTVPLPPSGMNVGDVTPQSVQLLWADVIGAEYYVVNIIDKNDVTIRSVTSQSNQLVVEDLTPGNIYRFTFVSVGKSERENRNPENIVTQQTRPTAPENLKFDDVTSSSVQLSWDSVNGALHYVISMSKNDNDDTIDKSSLSTNDTSTTFLNLNAGTQYWFTVKAVGHEELTSDSSHEIRDTTLPSAPSDVRVNSVNSTTIDLTWDNQKGATGYQISVSKTNQDAYFVNTVSNFTSISNLESGDVYTFIVVAMGTRGRLSDVASDPISQQTAPASPRNFQSSDVTTTSLTLSWDDVNGAVYYVINVYNENDDVTSSTTEKTFMTLTSLMSGSNYRFTVTAVGLVNLTGVTSQAISETTLPSRPSSVTVSDVTTNTVELEWNAQKGAENYVVTIENNEGIVNMSVESGSGAVTGVTVENLPAGTWHEFVIYSVGVKDRINRNGSDTARKQTVPSTPTDVVVTEVNVSSIGLWWKSVIGAQSYNIRVRSVDPDENEVILTTSETFISIESLSAGTAYDFYVTAVGEENQSSAESHVVRETTIPNIAGIPKVDDVTNSSVTLSWDDVRGAISYVIKVRFQSTSDVIMTVNSSNSFVTISGLDSGKFYNFTVLTIGHSGRANEEENAFVAQQTVPNPPEDFIVDDVTSSSITTSWNKVKGANFYVIEYTSNNTPLSSIITSDTAIVINKLMPGITYRFTVKAVGHENLTSAQSHELMEQTVPSSPASISVQTVTTSLVALEWTDVVGATSYLVDVTLEDSNDVIMSIDFATNEATIDDLKAGRVYRFQVFTYGEKQRINKDDFAVVTQQTVPLPPQELTVNDITSTSLQLTFTDVTGSIRYLVSVKSHLKDTLSILTSQTSIVINELYPGTIYIFTVKSVGHKNITSIGSHEVQTQTVPLPPSSLRVTTVTSQSINVEWSVAFGARSYIVNVTNSENVAMTRSLDATNNNIGINGLSAGTRYNIRVFSVGDQERISQTGSPIVTQQTAPNSPQNLAISEVTKSSLTLRWNKEKGADSYIVMYHEIDESLITNVTTKTPMIVFGKLNPVTEYRFTVIAVSPDGHMSRNSESITKMTLIDAPDTIEINDVTTSAVSLSWDTVEGASSYLLQVLPDVDGASITFPSDDVHDDVTGLVAGTRYRFRVTSVDPKGRRSPSWSREVVAVTVPLPPNEVTTSLVTSQSFVLQWEEMKGAVTYDVIVRDGSNVVTSQKVRTTRMSVVGLEPGTLYSVEVKSINVQNRISKTVVKQQRTAPLPPKVAVATRVNEDSVEIVWDAVKGASSYDVTVTEQKRGGKSFVVNTNATSALIGNIQSGTLYQVHVTSVTHEGIKSTRVTSLLVRTRPSAPTKLVSERINETAIGLSWNAVRGAETYHVYVISTVSDKRKAGTEFETKHTVTSNSVIIGDLKPGVNYTFEVTAINSDGFESKRSQSLTQQTYSLAPVLPTTREPLLTIQNTTQTSLVARWPQITNAVSYVIILRSDRGDKEYTVKGQTETSLEIDLLFADTHYNVTMKAVGASGATTEESSPPSRIRTKPFPPRIPTGLRATRIRSNHVIIVWSRALRALSYDVTVLNSETDSVQTIRNVKGTTTNVTDLRHRASYVITVTSVGKFEKSRASRSITVIPRFPSPVMPRHVVTPLMTIGSVTHDSFVVTLRPIPHAVSYEIQVKTRRQIPKRVGQVSALTPTLITELQQNTVYDVTFVAVGREGDRSRESDVVKTRTRRLVPGVPGDFQILHVTPNDVTVTWEPALRAIGYRVRAQNSKSGRIFVYNNATPPYVIKGLGYRNRYMLSVVSIGRYFESAPSSAVPVTIPYPNANNVSGIMISQITSSGFLVTWTPTPFARSYMLVVAIGNSMVRRINGISTNEYRLKDLAAGTDYNVTVNAVSSDSTTLTVGDWVAVKTAPFLPFARSIVTATGDPTTGILESVVTAFLETIQTIPDSPREGDDERLNRGGFVSGEDLEFRTRVLEHIQQISNAVQSTITRNSGGPKKVIGRRKRSTEGVAFESIVSIAREIKLLKESRDATNDTINSLSERLSQSLSVVVTSQMNDVTVVKAKSLLLPLLRQRLRMILLQESPVVIHVGSALTDERILSTFAPPSGVTSTGFKVMWVGFQNVHRFKLVVTKLDGDSSTPVFEGLRGGRSVFISHLQPSTNYDVTVRPATLRGDVIPGVVGKIIVRTLPARESTINVTVTSLGSSHVSLAINKFPKGVGTLKFEIRTPGNNRVLQLKLIKPQHKVVAFTSLSPNTDYIITASPVTSGTGISFRQVVATKQRPVFVRPTAQIVTQSPTDALAPPTGLRKTASTTNTVTLEWSSVRISGVASRFVRFNLRFYRAGTQIVSRSIRLLRNNKAVVRRLTYPFYDVTVTTYNMRTRTESPESPLLRVNLT
uniref:Receptor-type tyrosine-protein phosphatase eta-like n=1 Tax=Phallusia mammillata TaxID=59560 RepID=A0A6F9DQI9_9ASCI|nr:receptor-type tyrosine-protein phosphatase eta-like [Phallusia mammillata]